MVFPGSNSPPSLKRYQKNKSWTNELKNKVFWNSTEAWHLYCLYATSKHYLITDLMVLKKLFKITLLASFHRNLTIGQTQIPYTLHYWVNRSRPSQAHTKKSKLANRFTISNSCKKSNNHDKIIRRRKNVSEYIQHKPRPLQWQKPVLLFLHGDQ